MENTRTRAPLSLAYPLLLGVLTLAFQNHDARAQVTPTAATADLPAAQAALFELKSADLEKPSALQQVTAFELQSRSTVLKSPQSDQVRVMNFCDRLLSDSAVGRAYLITRLTKSSSSPERLLLIEALAQSATPIANTSQASAVATMLDREGDENVKLALIKLLGSAAQNRSLSSTIGQTLASKIKQYLAETQSVNSNQRSITALQALPPQALNSQLLATLLSKGVALEVQSAAAHRWRGMIPVAPADERSRILNLLAPFSMVAPNDPAGLRQGTASAGVSSTASEPDNSQYSPSGGGVICELFKKEAKDPSLPDGYHSLVLDRPRQLPLGADDNEVVAQLVPFTYVLHKTVNYHQVSSVTVQLPYVSNYRGFAMNAGKSVATDEILLPSEPGDNDQDSCWEQTPNGLVMNQTKLGEVNDMREVKCKIFLGTRDMAAEAVVEVAVAHGDFTRLSVKFPPDADNDKIPDAIETDPVWKVASPTSPSNPSVVLTNLDPCRPQTFPGINDAELDTDLDYHTYARLVGRPLPGPNMEETRQGDNFNLFAEYRGFRWLRGGFIRLISQGLARRPARKWEITSADLGSEVPLVLPVKMVGLIDDTTDYMVAATWPTIHTQGTRYSMTKELGYQPMLLSTLDMDDTVESLPGVYQSLWNYPRTVNFNDQKHDNFQTAIMLRDYNPTRDGFLFTNNPTAAADIADTFWPVRAACPSDAPTRRGRSSSVNAYLSAATQKRYGLPILIKHAAVTNLISFNTLVPGWLPNRALGEASYKMFLSIHEMMHLTKELTHYGTALSRGAARGSDAATFQQLLDTEVSNRTYDFNSWYPIQFPAQIAQSFEQALGVQAGTPLLGVWVRGGKSASSWSPTSPWVRYPTLNGTDVFETLEKKDGACQTSSALPALTATQLLYRPSMFMNNQAEFSNVPLFAVFADTSGSYATSNSGTEGSNYCKIVSHAEIPHRANGLAGFFTEPLTSPYLDLEVKQSAEAYVRGDLTSTICTF